MGAVARVVSQSSLPALDGGNELVLAARDGDSEAFARLYRAYAPTVHAIALARAPQHAEDVVHDVFEIALSRIDSLEDPEAFASWLGAIARNRATDLVRRERPTQEIEEGDLVAPEGSTQEARELLALIRSLPEAYSETLIMRFIEGMTGPEIAARTGLSRGSVRVNLSRGMKLLRAKLALKGSHV